MGRAACSVSRRRLLRASLALTWVGLGPLGGCSGLPVAGHRAAKVPRIGYLAAAAPGDPNAEAFLGGMRELGYVEGQNVIIEWRFADGRDEYLPQLAVDLLTLPVDLILGAGPSATRAARDATRTLPIVMCFPGDPIGLGFIASLDHPGSNVTGLASLTNELQAKRLELLAEALPGLSRVAVLWDPTAIPSARGPLGEAGRALELQLEYHEVRGPEELEGALAAASARRAEGLFVADSALFTTHRRTISELAVSNRLPATGAGKAFAEAGALLSYGARLSDMYRRAASSVDRILKGADPANLPVERPTTFDLVINLKTAQALALTIPQSVLQQATEILQ